jgi:plastocyanin
MKSPYRVLLLLSSLLAGLSAGCSKSPAPQSAQPVNSPAPQSASTTIDKSTLGGITGTISFSGPAPKLPALDFSADPACPADPQPQDVVLIRGGKLANVLVYVKGGVGRTFMPPSEPVVLDQKGCRYIPHVLGVMVGQPLKVLNDDNAEHNVHPMPKNNQEWNESQMPRGQPITKTFQHPEIMMPVKCNQHPWMQMYVNVMDNPFFAVSGDDGSFHIHDLPPGEYTVAAIHEKFGEQTMKVTVAPKQTASANFIFSAGPK